jgi:hypothetical protein
MRTASLLIVLIGSSLAGCSASLPTDPSFAPMPARLVVHYPISGTKATIGATTGSQQFEAYAVDANGVWTHATAQAIWSSSDPEGVVPSPSVRGVFTYRTPGSHVIYATLNGLRGELPLDVRPAPAYPYLDLQVQSGQFHAVYLMTSAGSGGRQQLTTSEVTIATSDESIAMIDRGTFRRVSPGNVIITATRNGLSDFYWRSVPPRE